MNILKQILTIYVYETYSLECVRHGPQLGDVGGEAHVRVHEDDPLDRVREDLGERVLERPVDARVVRRGDPGHRLHHGGGDLVQRRRHWKRKIQSRFLQIKNKI